MLQNKVKDLGNEKKMLITRLMQISFLVDDHVYNDKRIPATDAQAHIAELSSYNIRKYSDVRISQVTEKLLRCMKGIIVEEQEGLGLDTHVSDSIDEETNTKNISLPPHSELNIQFNVTTLVDIENGNENLNNNSSKTPIEENKPVSDPNDNVTENVTDDISIDESQCVLHNNAVTKEHGLETNTKNELNDKTGGKINEVVETESKNHLPPEGSCENNNKDVKNKFNLKKTERKKITSKSTVENKIKKKAKVSKPRVSKIKPKNKCTQEIKTDKSKNTKLKEKITSIEPKLLQEGTELDKNTIDNLETNNNTVTCKDTRKMVIYKKTTVDDLSWIEDIRYVREIDSQEFDEKNILQDVFWNDYTLPPDLSEEDFMLRCD